MKRLPILVIFLLDDYFKVNNDLTLIKLFNINFDQTIG